MNGAIYVERSVNSKIGKADVTYTSIKATCSHTCPLRSGTCYAKNSFVGMHNVRMDRRARYRSPLFLARAEAKAIDASYKGKKVPDGRLLRLHISGDSRTVKGTRVLNKAIGRWKARGKDLICWSYTHSWKKVARKEWSNVSILASIERVDQVAKAHKQGYACAIVVPEHPSNKAFTLPNCTTKWIPCPAQTNDDVSCSSCRLCMKSDFLYATNRGIAFAAHGIKKAELKRRLTVIQ